MTRKIGYGNFDINENPLFKKGDKVKMVDCFEANHHDIKGDNEWICKDDDFNTPNGRAVFMEGFAGYFTCAHLEIIKRVK